MDTQFPRLLSPTRIGNVEIRNRLVSAAYPTRMGSIRSPRFTFVALPLTIMRATGWPVRAVAVVEGQPGCPVPPERGTGSIEKALLATSRPP